MLDHGADPNAKAALDITPLHLAADNGFVNVVRILMEHGANPTLKDKYGKTPTQAAAKRKHKEVVAALLGKPFSQE